jgi:hypothetical protein
MQDCIVQTVDEEKIRHEASAFGANLYRQGLAQWREISATA